MYEAETGVRTAKGSRRRSLARVRTFSIIALLAGLFLAGSASAASEDAKLTSNDANADDMVGHSVSISGDTVVLGAPNDDDEDDSGAAYVFVRSGATWSQQAKLKPADSGSGDRFGWSVAIDGDTVVIGAEGDTEGGLLTGSAYVFVRTGTTWSQQAKLLASDGASEDKFGDSVAIDGDTVLVGSFQHDPAVTNAGSVYVFTRTGTAWSEEGKLVASDASLFDHFGDSVALSGDTALVGAPGNDDDGADSGSAYVFTRTGTTWTQRTKLIASDAAAGDKYGQAVAIDGTTALVGPFANENAYVYTGSGASWSEQQKLTPADAAGGNFGSAVAVSGDAAVIGAPGADSAYVFSRSGSTWSQLQKPTATDVAAGDEFGFAVDVEGDTVLVGSRLDDDAGASSGSAYVFPTQPTDTTPPTVSVEVTGTLGSNDWYTSDVDISWTVTDPDSPVVETGCEPVSIIEDTDEMTVTCSATSDGGTTTEDVTIKRDATEPLAAASSQPAPMGGWNRTDVTVTFEAIDALSGLDSCSDPVVVDTDAMALVVEGSCTDLAGNEATPTATVNLDKTAPSLTVVVSPNPVLQGSPATVSANAVDPTSGIASESCGAIDTSTLGTFSVSCNATDVAGNPASMAITYTVVSVDDYGECGGLTPTIVGTEGRDLIRGTDGDDVILGLGGNDVIRGLGGDDVICGDGGRDRLFGGPGNDIIYGGKQNDAIKGDQQNDELYGNEGRDRMIGGSGSDDLTGGAGTKDVLDGKAGDDGCIDRQPETVRINCERTQPKTA